MYFLLSPAKNLNETATIPFDFSDDYRQPALISKACELMGNLKSLEPTDLSALMGISAKLAHLNAVRNQQWAWDESRPFRLDHPDMPAKPAVYLFDGEVYTGLAAADLTQPQIAYLNRHLGILSGLYGLLKPLDLILPYRLEMGTKLVTTHGSNLYDFWGDAISELINQRMAAAGSKVLVNLASQAYFKAVKPQKITADIITPRFETGNNGSYKVVSFYAKKARGLMVQYAARQQLTQVEALKNFDLAGYYFVDALSTRNEWVFRQDKPD